MRWLLVNPSAMTLRAAGRLESICVCVCVCVCACACVCACVCGREERKGETVAFTIYIS